MDRLERDESFFLADMSSSLFCHPEHFAKLRMTNHVANHNAKKLNFNLHYYLCKKYPRQTPANSAMPTDLKGLSVTSVSTLP